MTELGLCLAHRHFYLIKETEITEPIRNKEAYTRILREEIVPATGFTEPISIAYCAAKAHQILGMQPTSVTVSVSESVLKNAEGVVVPNTNGLKGIRAAVATGIICGDADKGMQVIGNISDDQLASVAHFMDAVSIDVSCAETDCQLYISLTLYARTSYSRVVIASHYFDVVEIMKNGEALLKRPIVAQSEDNSSDRSCLNLRDIIAYADRIEIAEVQDLLDMQINYNMTISKEGLQHHYGADIGKILLRENESDVKTAAKAYAVSASEARLNGCDLPVAILCGSGNQGIVATVPVLCYAKHITAETERIYRALILSDLLTVFLNENDDRFSPYCGAIRAGCAVGAGIAYLLGGDENAVSETLQHAVSMITDMNCDGAKPACAAKVAAAIDTGILGYQMYLHDKER